MKTPLRFQITEYDCGSISLINCITKLFERNEIPVELIKSINTYTLDCYDQNGELGKRGTSREAVKFLSRWICDYANNHSFGLKLKYLSGSEVTLEAVEKCIRAGGVVNFRTYQQGEHYVTITAIDDENVYIFDPYYLPQNSYKNTKNIEIIFDKPFDYNRKVKKQHFIKNTKTEFSLGPTEKREAVLFNRV